MKWLLTFLMFISLNAFANPIIIEIDGVRHACNPIGAGNALKCIMTAENGPFSRDEATQLCKGAYNEAPASCATFAYNGSFSKSQSIAICTGATSMGPIQCANMAYDGPFSRDEAIRLCSNDGSQSTVTCALEAYNGRYSKEEAINLCRNSNRYNEKVLMSPKIISKKELIKLTKKANRKAIERKEYK